LNSDKPSESRQPSDSHERDHTGRDQHERNQKENEHSRRHDSERSKLESEDRDSRGAERTERGTKLPDRSPGGGGVGGGSMESKNFMPPGKTPEEQLKELEKEGEASRKREALEKEAKLRQMARSGR